MASAELERATLHWWQTKKLLGAVAITYTRPGVGSVSLRAVPTNTTHQTAQDGVVIDQFQARDYTVLASELVLNGTATLPQRNDTILEGTTSYQIMSAGGEPQYRYTDPTKLCLRIHCMEVS